MMPGFDFRKSGPGKADHSVLVGIRPLQSFPDGLRLPNDDLLSGARDRCQSQDGSSSRLGGRATMT
jgi:hypothetical protein